MLFDYTLDKQYQTQPQDVRFCARCVVSNQRPRIVLDENGVCSACRYAEEKHHVIPWGERERELRDLLDRFRSRTGSFDVVVPGSGGKDSFYVAGTLRELGMHPLCVTWAPFEYTDVGWKNFMIWNEQFNVRTHFPARSVHRKLARLAFELVGDSWQPFTYGQKAYAMQVAASMKIPLIFYGESGEIEYGGSTQNKARAWEGPEDWESLYFKGCPVDVLAKHGVEAGIFREMPNLSMYKPPDADVLTSLGVQMHWMSYYRKWIPQENYYYATAHGFQANAQRSEGTYSKYASLDDRADGMHFYLAYIKFGIARATSDAAHEIRDGHITRDEGVALVRRYDGEFPVRNHQWFLDYHGITEDQFQEVIEFYRGLSPHLWNGKTLKHTAWGEPKQWII